MGRKGRVRHRSGGAGLGVGQDSPVHEAIRTTRYLAWPGDSGALAVLLLDAVRLHLSLIVKDYLHRQLGDNLPLIRRIFVSARYLPLVGACIADRNCIKVQANS